MPPMQRDFELDAAIQNSVVRLHDVGLGRAGAEELADGDHEVVVHLGGFVEDVIDAQAEGAEALGGILGRECGDDDDGEGHGSLGVAKDAQESHAIHAGHHDVEKDEIDVVTVEGDEGFPAVGGLNRVIALALQKSLEYFPGIAVVIDDENRRRWRGHVGRSL